MEYRKFGKTGLETSLLGFGGFHLLEIPLSEAKYLLNKYIDAGGNYIETAASYGNGESERKIGNSISDRRNEFILVSKTGERDKESAANEIDLSLKNLKTDYLDVILMHGVGTVEELDQILVPGGAMEAALEAKKDGKVHHIGLSMHGQPEALIEALKRDVFEVVMSTINYYDNFNYPEIENVLLPLAKEKNVGVILMKPLADGFLYKSTEQAFRYAFSQDVSVVVTGMNSRAMLQKDLELAENFVPMTQEEIDILYRDAVELGNYICRQCGKCKCSKGIDIPEVFACEGYYDRQMAKGVVENTAEYALAMRLRFWFNNKELAMNRYSKMPIQADKCDGCGDCIKMCPYNIDIPYKMHMADYKLMGRNIW